MLGLAFPNENFSKIRKFLAYHILQQFHVIDIDRTSGSDDKTSGLLADYYVRIFMSYTFSIIIHLGIACLG